MLSPESKASSKVDLMRTCKDENFLSPVMDNRRARTLQKHKDTSYIHDRYIVKAPNAK